MSSNTKPWSLPPENNNVANFHDKGILKSIREEATKLGISPEEDVSDQARNDNKELNLVMTALNIFSPMITALVSHHDKLTIEDNLVDLASMVRSADDSVSYIANALREFNVDIGKKENVYVMRQLLKNLAIVTAKQFVSKSTTDNQLTKHLYGSLIGGLFGTVPSDVDSQNKQLMSDLVVKTKSDFNSLESLLSAKEAPVIASEESALACSLLKSMEPVVAELQRFSWFTDPEVQVQGASQDVIEGASFLYRRSIDEKLITPDDKGRLMFLQSCLDKAGSLYAKAYSEHAYLAIDKIGKLADKDDKRRAALQYRIDGVPRDDISKTFNRSLALQLNMAVKGSEFLKRALEGELLSTKKHQRDEENGIQIPS